MLRPILLRTVETKIPTTLPTPTILSSIVLSLLLPYHLGSIVVGAGTG